MSTATSTTGGGSSSSSSSSSVHGSPSGDCVICCEDFTCSNYVEYQTHPSSSWYPSPYCQTCIQTMFLEKQWSNYLEQLEKADCAAALKRLLTSPPPLYVTDAGFKRSTNAVHPNDSTGECYQFWWAASNEIASAKLKGALEGKAREDFWEEKKKFLTATEIAEELAKKDKDKEKEKSTAH